VVNVNLAANTVGIAVEIVIAIGQINTVNVRTYLFNLQKLLKIIGLYLCLVFGLAAVEQHQVSGNLLLINSFAAFAFGDGLVT